MTSQEAIEILKKERVNHMFFSDIHSRNCFMATDFAIKALDRPNSKEPTITKKRNDGELIVHDNDYGWGNSITLVREPGIALIRMSITNDEPEVAFLEGLSVKEEYRRKGIGRAMLSRALDLAKERGLKYAYLRAEKESFVFGWYRRLGFRYYGDKPDENGFVPMYKTL